MYGILSLFTHIKGRLTMQLSTEERVALINTNLVTMMRIRGYNVEKETKDVAVYKEKFVKALEREYEKDQKTLGTLLEEVEQEGSTTFLTRVFVKNPDNQKNLPEKVLVYFAKAGI